LDSGIFVAIARTCFRLMRVQRHGFELPAMSHGDQGSKSIVRTTPRHCRQRQAVGTAVCWWLLGLLMYCVSGVVVAAPDVQGVTVEQVKHALAGVKANGDIDKAVQDKAKEIYQQALSALDVTEDRDTKATALQQQGETAPAELARLQRQLNAVERALTPKAVAQMDVDELTKRQKKLAARATELQAKLQDLHA